MFESSPLNWLFNICIWKLVPCKQQPAACWMPTFFSFLFWLISCPCVCFKLLRAIINHSYHFMYKTKNPACPVWRRAFCWLVGEKNCGNVLFDFVNESRVMTKIGLTPEFLTSTKREKHWSVDKGRVQGGPSPCHYIWFLLFGILFFQHQ